MHRYKSDNFFNRKFNIFVIYFENVNIFWHEIIKRMRSAIFLHLGGFHGTVVMNNFLRLGEQKWLK